MWQKREMADSEAQIHSNKIITNNFGDRAVLSALWGGIWKLKKKIESQHDKNILYTAIKLIQALYKEGHVSDYIYNNILNEYKRDIDISNFIWYTCYKIRNRGGSRD